VSSSKPDLLNLLVLPPLQKSIVVHLTRKGPTDIQILGRALDHDQTEIEEALAVLVKQGHIQISANGQADMSLGRTRRRTLPARLWPALLANSRLYSTQEIATLRTVIPILQFARAKMSEFADHGLNHALRVKSFATQLGYILNLTETEQHLLRAAALFHDVGNVVERESHHVISQETVEKLALAGQLPFSVREAELVGLVCRWHRRDYDPDRRDKLRGELVRTGLLASILRVADAMDIDHRRSDYTDQLSWVLQFFYPRELPYWTSLEEILGVRIRCTPSVNLQVLTRGQIGKNMQIDMLRKDLNSTPLEWKVQQTAIENETPYIQSPQPQKDKGESERAILVFPFDAHSLVMGALSRKHLLAAGYTIELLCYPDTVDESAWLWGEALSEADPAEFARLVVIGDRPDPTITSNLLETIDHWQAAGVTVSLLNRHEENWSRLPDLLQRGVDVILGGDWAYFWGDSANQTDLAWGRIAALCIRDPTQSTIGITVEERAVTQGLLKVVYDVIKHSTDDVASWANLAKPILTQISTDNQACFIDHAESFVNTYTKAIEPGRVEGRVLRFEGKLGTLPQSYYWALEAAIEQHGRTSERGLCFNIPYAIATWPDDGIVELLAINHWREERAIPIRLLYPTDLGPPPEGNECTIRVRLSANQADTLVSELVNACNRS
jgi:hypothetical protein